MGATLLGGAFLLFVALTPRTPTTTSTAADTLPRASEKSGRMDSSTTSTIKTNEKSIEPAAKARAERLRLIARHLGELESADARVRLAAVKGLKELSNQPDEADPDIVPPLVKALNDPTHEVRKEAFDVVVKVRGRKFAVPDLIEALKSQDAGVRADAVSMLNTVGADAAEAAPALVECLGDQKVQPNTVQALGRIGKPAVPFLIKALASQDSVVRLGAVQAIKPIGPGAADAAPPLIGLLKDPKVRREAILALGNIGKPAVPGLVKALDEPDPETRGAAIITLGHIGPDAREALPNLRTISRTDPNPDVRVTASTAIDRINR